MRLECARCGKSFDAEVEDVKQQLNGTPDSYTLYVDCRYCGQRVYSLYSLAGRYKRMQKK